MTIARWITSAGTAILAVVFIVRLIRDHRYLFNYTIPQQLVQLVRQAHGVSTVGTALDIRIPPEMRDALCATLTQAQLETMRAAGEGVYIRNVSCHLVSSRF